MSTRCELLAQTAVSLGGAIERSAFLTPPPGFLFGKDGDPSPLKVSNEVFGRIAFGMSGTQGWNGAATDGKRAITQLLQTL